MQNEEERDLYRELGLKPPEHLRHLTEDELREKLKIQTEHNWKQRGNSLYCKCDLGFHTSNIPTSHMLTGTTDSGQPILTKIKL